MENRTTWAIERSDANYPPPRGNVLLLTCMDVRLIDELAAFMGRDNLTNRYDHLILAGASLGVMQGSMPNWREVFFDHLRLALELRQPRDVYIIEHRNCGAYRKFLGLDFDDSPAAQEEEREAHRQQAAALGREIDDWCTRESESTGVPVRLNVRAFLMDLRGGVELLDLA